MTAKEAAEKWAITPLGVQVLYKQGKILGAVRFGVTWVIPEDAIKPRMVELSQQSQINNPV